MISEKTGCAESFSCGLTQQLFEAVSKVRAFARCDAARISCCFFDARRDPRQCLARCWYVVPSAARSRFKRSRVHDEGLTAHSALRITVAAPPGTATVRLVVRPPSSFVVVLARFTGSRIYDTPLQATMLYLYVNVVLSVHDTFFPQHHDAGHRHPQGGIRSCRVVSGTSSTLTIRSTES